VIRVHAVDAAAQSSKRFDVGRLDFVADIPCEQCGMILERFDNRIADRNVSRDSVPCFERHVGRAFRHGVLDAENDFDLFCMTVVQHFADGGRALPAIESEIGALIRQNGVETGFRDGVDLRFRQPAHIDADRQERFPVDQSTPVPVNSDGLLHEFAFRDNAEGEFFFRKEHPVGFIKQSQLHLFFTRGHWFEIHDNPVLLHRVIPVQESFFSIGDFDFAEITRLFRLFVAELSGDETGEFKGMILCGKSLLNRMENRGAPFRRIGPDIDIVERGISSAAFSDIERDMAFDRIGIIFRDEFALDLLPVAGAGDISEITSAEPLSGSRIAPFDAERRAAS